MNIVASENANMNFQMNFISLLINSLIESSSAKKANIYPINYITKITNISNIDWCSYLFDCLVKTKQSFYLDHVIIFFLDHMLFLVVRLITSILFHHSPFTGNECSKKKSNYLSLDVKANEAQRNIHKRNIEGIWYMTIK
uniref:Uncharacterized protein n=1 Tax=Lactuca sativa TaxID=4236 RepID=A0A9R1W3J5_LACSA|nr:hypothetical protein LSAT_V11C300102820 [Lactuca sativa]